MHNIPRVTVLFIVLVCLLSKDSKIHNDEHEENCPRFRIPAGESVAKAINLFLHKILEIAILKTNEEE